MRSRKWTVFNARSCRALAVAAALFCALSWGLAAEAGNSWHEHVQKLQQLRGQINNFEHEIHGLIAAKKKTEDPAQIKEITNEMAKQYAELVKISQEYEEIRLHLRFKHPDRDLASERNYSRHQLKSLKDMESEFGLDGRLDRLKSRILVTFPHPVTEKPKNEITLPHTEVRKPASVEDDEEKPERIILRASEPEKHGSSQD
jgi:hypothetical protein